MSSQQPFIEDSRGRRFALSAAAVLAFIVNNQRQFLMLKHPVRDGWEVINGALDAGETILEGLHREIREEAGAQIQVRPLGTVHAYTFRYDSIVQHMLSIAYLLAYEGGTIQPGDDMAGSTIHGVP